MITFNRTSLLLVVLSLITVLNDSGCTKGYEKFPSDFDEIDELIKAVHPDKNYSYWELCEGPQENAKPIFSRGKKLGNIKFKPPLLQGIFTTSHLILHYYYIDYIYQGKIGYITSDEDFKNFLGTIDNLQEAVLLAKESEELGIDHDNVKGGSYLVNDEGYNVRLMRYNSCPETKESIYMMIDRQGNIVKNSNLGIYFQSKSCIEY